MNIRRSELRYRFLLKIRRIKRRYRILQKFIRIMDKYGILLLILVLMLLIGITGSVLNAQEKKNIGYVLPFYQLELKHRLSGIETETERMQRVRMEAEAYGYPESVIELLDKNPETIGFVEDYYEKKDQPAAKTIGDDYVEGEIPLLLQWDERWGYSTYGTSIIAVSGCGPTCMAMVASGLNQDPSITPAVMAEYSMKHEYVDEENNTYWALMEDSCGDWNLNVEAGIFDEARIEKELTAGHPIICIMGPGDFTQEGHFIVLTGYTNGRLKINDPFSKTNSEKEWIFSEIQEQINGMWIYSLKK